MDANTLEKRAQQAYSELMRSGALAALRKSVGAAAVGSVGQDGAEDPFGEALVRSATNAALDGSVRAGGALPPTSVLAGGVKRSADAAAARHSGAERNGQDYDRCAVADLRTRPGYFL